MIENAKQVYSFRLEDEMVKDLRKIAAHLGVSLTTVVAGALVRYIKNSKRKKPCRSAR